MITLKDGKGIRWEHEDVRLMAKIIGSEHAVIGVEEKYGWAPPLGSIIKLAARKNALISTKARKELEILEIYRKFCHDLKIPLDAKLDDPFAEKLFGHQRADLVYIQKTKRPAYLLASKPGVGKTPVAIRAAEHWNAKRIAVITPGAAKEQWRDEIRRWRTHKRPIRIVDGTIAEQEKIISDTTEGWVIGHWESLVHARDAWTDSEWNLVIGDEAQYAQNRNAQRSDTLFKLGRLADYRLALSAHPFTNAVKELFPLLKFLYPKLYPGFWLWAHLHIQIDEGPFGAVDLSTPRRPKLLKWELEPIILRRTKKQVWKDLPPITRVRRVAHLSNRGRREYDKLRKQFFVELKAHKGQKNILAIPSVLARITRLRQYLIDPGILGAKEPSVKYPIVAELIHEMAGTPPVIFTMYRKAAFRLKAYLKKRGLKTRVLAGGMKNKAEKIKKQFLRGKLDAVILLISVGGTALNYGKYGYVIHLDLPWNPRDYEQTEGRVDRPEEGTGIIVPTTSYRLIVKDSYEERMEEKNQGKHKNYSKVFTVDDAKELFAT